MDAGEIYHFLFETYAGVGVLVLAVLIISIILAVILEMRTRKTFRDRGPRTEDDEWSLFDDSDDEQKKEAAAEKKAQESAPVEKPKVKTRTVKVKKSE